jgi:hypothetical protein
MRASSSWMITPLEIEGKTAYPVPVETPSLDVLAGKAPLS